MPYKDSRKPDRIYLWITKELKKRVQTVVAKERQRTGYPISMSSFTRRALEAAVKQFEGTQ